MGPKRTPSKSPRREDSASAKKVRGSDTKRSIDEVDDVEDDEEILTPKKSNRGNRNAVITDSRGRSKSPAPVAAATTASSSPASSKSVKQAPKSSGKKSKVNTPVRDAVSDDIGSSMRTKAAPLAKPAAASVDINTIKLKSKISMYNIKSSRKRYSDQIWEDEEELSSGYAGLIVVIIATTVALYCYGAKINVIQLCKMPYEMLESGITTILGKLTSSTSIFFTEDNNKLIGHLVSFMINTSMIYTALFIPIVYYFVEKDHTSSISYLVFTLVIFAGLSYYHHQCADIACFQSNADDVLKKEYLVPLGNWFTRPFRQK